MTLIRIPRNKKRGPILVYFNPDLVRVTQGFDDDDAAALIASRVTGSFIASVPIWQLDCRFAHASDERFVTLPEQYPEPVYHQLRTQYEDRIRGAFLIAFHERIP